MTEKNIYPADNVDKDGVAYPTVGENIRNGNNRASLDFTTSDDVNNWLFNTLSESERNMLPIFPFSKGKWVKIVDTITDGGLHSVDKLQDVTHPSTNRILYLNKKVKFIMQYSTSYTGDRTIFAIRTQISQQSNARETNSFSVSFEGQSTPSLAGESCIFYVYLED